jgi:hypothetical protein
MKALRPRRIYWRPAGGYVGFGRSVPQQPDLLESEWRLGWRILVVCRVCLLAERDRLQAEADRLRVLARRASTNVSEGIFAIERHLNRDRKDDR